MYLHPDGIARRIRWRDEQGGRPDWGRVLDQEGGTQVAENLGLQP